MIGREKEVEQVEEFIKRRRSVLILGIKGIGKTTFLKFLEKKHKGCYIEHCSPKSVLENLVNYFNIKTKRSTRYLTINELFRLVKPFIKRKKPLVLVDDVDFLSKYCGKLLQKIESCGAVIVGASERHIWNFSFKEKIVLDYLSREDSKELARCFLREIATEDVLDLIATKSFGLPEKIKEICGEYEFAFKNLEVVPFDKKSLFDFFMQIKPHIPKRANIFPTWLLFVIGFGALTIKVLLYSKGDFHDAYIIAAFGYTSLIIYRLATLRRR